MVMIVLVIVAIHAVLASNAYIIELHCIDRSYYH